MCSINNAILSTLVLSLSVALIACSPLGGSRIWEGFRASEGQFPYQVALHMTHPIKEADSTSDDQYTFRCGGAILSKNFIVTAAHCIGKDFEKKPEQVYHVRVNARNRTDGEVYEVKHIYLHENFTLEKFKMGRLEQTLLDNDIALIELETPLKFSDNVSPIKLNSRFIPDKVTGIVSGYGLSSQWLDISDLNYIDVKTWTSCDSNGRFRTSTSLCALPVKGFYEPGGPMIGDSGDPLVNEGGLIGLYTFGSDINLAFRLRGFTRTSLFVDWIEETMHNAIQN